MATAKIKFKNKYDTIGRKDEFARKLTKEDMTDQSQIIGASIVEMAKRFGIDAIIAKAEQRIVDNEKLLDKLYGNDYTKLFTSKEEMLNTRKKLIGMFETIPARIRKEVFNDNVGEWLNAYTMNDETKLGQLNKIGLVSDSQMEQVKTYNKNKRLQMQEEITRQNFIKALETQKEGLYETFKTTGSINFNSGNDSTTNNTNVQTDIQ